MKYAGAVVESRSVMTPWRYFAASDITGLRERLSLGAHEERIRPEEVLDNHELITESKWLSQNDLWRMQVPWNVDLEELAKAIIIIHIYFHDFAGA